MHKSPIDSARNLNSSPATARPHYSSLSGRWWALSTRNGGLCAVSRRVEWTRIQLCRCRIDCTKTLIGPGTGGKDSLKSLLPKFFGHLMRNMQWWQALRATGRHAWVSFISSECVPNVISVASKNADAINQLDIRGNWIICICVFEVCAFDLASLFSVFGLSE